MLLIIELAMLFGGIYSIITAKVPSFLTVGGKFQVEGRDARFLGTLLSLPLPVAIAGGVVLSLFLGEDSTGYTIMLEFLTIFGVSLLAVVFVRVVGKNIEPVNDQEATISKKAQGALMYAIFSATGFAALICCPMAFVHANQAVNLIDEHGIGQQYRKKAKTARAIAGIATLLWVSVVFCFASFMFKGVQ